MVHYIHECTTLMYVMYRDMLHIYVLSQDITKVVVKKNGNLHIKIH